MYYVLVTIIKVIICSCSRHWSFIFLYKLWLTLMVWCPLYTLTHCWPIKLFSAVDLKPSQPTNLHVSEVNGESVVLKWDPPENHAVVTNYTIMYRKAESKGSYSQVQCYYVVDLSTLDVHVHVHVHLTSV